LGQKSEFSASSKRLFDVEQEIWVIELISMLVFDK